MTAIQSDRQNATNQHIYMRETTGSRFIVINPTYSIVPIRLLSTNICIHEYIHPHTYKVA